MCCGCWADDGAHRIDNERVRSVQVLIERVYEFSDGGGNLHIVLDDNNVEDSNLEFCAKQIANGGWKDDRPLSPNTEFMRHQWPDPPDQLSAEKECCEALQAMTFEERVSALGLRDGCWTLEAGAPPVPPQE